MKTGHHCRRWVKEVTRGVGTTAARPARDPLYAKFAMDDEADALLLFNARDVDSRGRPLLMKVVAREGVDLAELDLSRFRTRWADVPDVQRVSQDAACVEIHDETEIEFAFGDPLLYLSIGNGRELSRGVAVGPDNTCIVRDCLFGPDGLPDPTRPVRGATPVVTVGAQLDQQPPMCMSDRIRIEMSANASFNSEAWLGASEAGVDTILRVAPGLIYEPKAEAKVGFAEATAAVSVPANDAFLLCSPAVSVPVPKRSRSIESRPTTAGASNGLGEFSVCFEAHNFRALLSYDGSLEIRVYNNDGIPAERITIPFREMPWAAHPEAPAAT